MSSGLECRFIHVTSGWYYLLESVFYREVYQAYGPFSSYKRADAHLVSHQQNPGGAMIDDPVDGPGREPTRWEAQWLKDAER